MGRWKIFRTMHKKGSSKELKSKFLIAGIYFRNTNSSIRIQSDALITEEQELAIIKKQNLHLKQEKLKLEI